MLRSLPTFVMFTVIGCLAANQSSAQVVKQEVPGVTNFAKVESTVACGGAITPAAILELKKMGYASIINLRLATEPGADIERHTAVAKSAGIPYHHIPFSTTFRSASRRRIPRPLTRFSRRSRRPRCSPRSFIERPVDEAPGCGS